MKRSGTQVGLPLPAHGVRLRGEQRGRRSVHTPGDVRHFTRRDPTGESSPDCHGARALGMGDRLGTVEKGKLTDLFVVRGNPLAKIRNTRRVQVVIRAALFTIPTHY
ncbi:MAG TPA: amidohydrolase family protein [Gemmatimonadaceae bacterium]